MSKKPEAKSSVAKAAEAMANEVKAFAAAKESEAKKPEVKEEPKKEVVKEMAGEAKATVAKAGKKAAAKVKKTTAKAVKEKVQPKLILEFNEYSADLTAVTEKVKGIYVADGHRESSIKSLEIYLKPFENSAYYVINDKINGRIDLF